MKILFLTPHSPFPPDRGTALRNWGLMGELARRHSLSLLSFDDSIPEEGVTAAERNHALEALTAGRFETVPMPRRGFSVRLRDLVLSRAPDMALRLASNAFAVRLREWLTREHFDVIQIEGIEMAPYLDVITALGAPGITLFDDHNAEWVLQQRAFDTDVRALRRLHGAAYSFVQWQRLKRYEAAVCRRVDRVTAVSARDAAALRAIAPGLDVRVVPNGIELEAYNGVDGTAVPAYDLLFTGKMDFRPNVDAMLWFTEAIWPRVRAALPATTLGIVGQKPHARLARLRAEPGITLTGYVPNVRPYVARAAVYVAPLRMGGGTRFKLLEAMALERAIVSTHLGAEGLDAPEGSAWLADDPEAFAAAVIALLQAPAQRAALGARARAHVAAHFTWKAIVPILEQAYG